jgi:nicotinate-nucleotide adenylyltransferase
MVAAWLRWSGLVDEVWLVPTPSHPFAKDLADFSLRVAMCEGLAGVVGPWVKVSTIEATLQKPTYTVNTLLALSEQFPKVDFRLVVGADTIPEWPKWRDWEKIEKGFAPIVVGRQGYEAPPDAVSFPNISSTEVRQRLAQGLPVEHLVPREVRDVLGDVYAAGSA